MGTREIVRSMVFVAVAVLLFSNAPDATAQTIQPTVDGTIQDAFRMESLTPFLKAALLRRWMFPVSKIGGL